MAPAHRGRGLGRQLVDETLARLRRHGIQKCSISLYTDNAAGRAFWLREGWTPREDLLVMQKVIRSDGRIRPTPRANRRMSPNR